MSENLSRLLSISSAAIAGPPSAEAIAKLTSGKSVGLEQELGSLLGDKNGFFSYESALVVRPLDYESQPLGILQWNNSSVWRAEYKVDLGESVFFAEDVFGVQFCIRDNFVQSFDPETGRFTKTADTLESWARWILEDHKVRTGWPLAHQWQTLHGALLPGTRLLPKVPFVCGGQFSTENLYALKDVHGMCFRASIANQLVGVPDGAKIVLKIQRNEQP
jgi:hypothetical protein